ncbi:Protein DETOXIFICATION 41 [Trifolium repens]|nr:Protein DETOXIFICATION 41 [Trifolium repens]
MNPWKAPGPDGFQAGFYQQSWDIVGPSVCDFVQKVWRMPSTIAMVNQTDICLIPKVDHPELVTQFRPISLCNTIYKIVSKVIVARLKNYIPKLVSPFQTGFVPGRNIHENIVVTKEMVHSMHMAKGRKGFFAIKVDLSKAYDKLSWEFVWRVLTEANFPDNIINIIMHSVTSVETNVKWHGARAEYFRPQRGIRQGDPISPYLFVLCMDKLSHLICHAVDEGDWRTLRACRNGHLVSHLMFADDLLLFGEATEKQVQCTIRILNAFCNMSGQEVSREKTSILFSKNVDRNTRVKLVQMSGFRESNQLGKYLGVPLKGRAPRREDFQYVIDQVSAKLTNWKAQHLSFAGRVTLAKSVIEAIPIYPMMTNKIPKSCLEEIQKLQRNFIWGDRDGVKKYHAIGWEKVTKPKYCGGLGLRRLDVMNQACILKLGWKLASGANDLWCKVMRGKYDCRAMKGEVRVQNSASNTVEEFLEHRPIQLKWWLKLVAWESRVLWILSGASIVVYLFNYMLSFATLTFSGHLGSLELASASIASVGIQGLAYGIMVGMASAVQTVCGQAYGAKKYAVMCITLQRAVILHLGAAVVLTFLYWFSGDFLRLIGQTKSIAEQGQVFARGLIPQLYAFALICPMQRFLQAQNIVNPLAYMAVGVFLLHVLLSWLVVYVLHYRLLGAALTLSFSWWILVFLEIWYNQGLVLISGLLPNPTVALDSISICMNYLNWDMQIVLGLGAAASVRVSNELGAGHPRVTKLSVLVVNGNSIIIINQSVSKLTPLLAIQKKKKKKKKNSIACHLCPLKWHSTYTIRCCSWKWMASFGGLCKLGVAGLWWGLILGVFIQTVTLIILTARTNWEAEVEKAIVRVKRDSEDDTLDQLPANI